MGDCRQESMMSVEVMIVEEEQEQEQHERRRDGGQDGASDPAGKCRMWMSKKGRFCASHALPNSLYCGNHRPSTGETRVPCPIDPSHTILEEDVASHVKKCSATKQSKHFESQPYFFQGLNAGSDGEEEGASTLNAHDHSADISIQGQDYQSCGAKRAAITGISGDQFREFVRRIESAYEACSQETVAESILQPPQCSRWWDPERDRRLPFQEKHVSQQASLLGNLEAFGLLKAGNEKVNANSEEPQDEKKEWVYVEFGAGRGYLGHMLCDSYGVSSVVLVERRAYKFKADRTLRQILGVSVERLRTDIEDLSLQGVELLRGRQFVAVSKHLCGPATDLTLRCCLKGENGTFTKSSNQQDRFAEPVLEGIGIATCCHHLCQWKSYVNKEFFGKLGFSIIDFNMITWLTSWAVNEGGGHCAAEIDGSVDQKAMREESLQLGENDGRVKPRLSEALDSWDPAERAALGRKCKHILDHGRLLWLKQHGMDAKIVKYISSSVTPENKLLLARKGLP